MSKLADLSLTDDFLFNLFVQENGNEELLKGVLERLIGTKIAEIKLREKQHPIITDPNYHGSRLDAYIKTVDGDVFNVEVQNTDPKDLVKRMRFYLSLIDKESMPSGEYNYNVLPKTVIIFICNFDCLEKVCFVILLKTAAWKTSLFSLTTTFLKYFLIPKAQSLSAFHRKLLTCSGIFPRLLLPSPIS